jgi:aspartyl-tRNA synthetase
MIFMHRTHYINEAKSSNGEKVSVAGWVHDVRDLGKLKFVILRDRSGLLQVTLKSGLVPDEVLEKAELNKEDVVAFSGTLKENKIAPDGVELIPDKLELLNCVERKLPVDPTSHVDSELDTRLDYRYLDLRKDIIRTIFQVKSVCSNAFREKLLELGFTEIHPSAISGAATEGGADVFPIQYFENKAYLVQSPQLYKQLAVIGGFDRVFCTMSVFRAEKHNTTSHLNEATQMDIEMGFADHTDAMDMYEKVMLHILSKVDETMGEEIRKLSPDFSAPKSIPRHTYTELIDKLKGNGYAIEWGEDFSREAEKKIYEILGEDIYVIYDWPTEIRAFYSMPDHDNPKICHAYDLMYKGLEISSGAKRIHVPSILEEQLKARGLDVTDFEFYLNAFRMGAPPHAGWSIGLERLVMKICNLENIREAMLFPRDRTRLHP